MTSNQSDVNIKRKSIIVISIVLLVVIFVIIGIYKIFFKEYETYTVINGYAEKAVNTDAYIIKNEQVIELSNSNVTVPLIEQDKRIEKNGTIAIYKDSGYQEYLDKINKLDSQIEVLIKDLPYTYSTDLENINNDINKLINNSKKITSYIKMQEYKTKLNELANKKITLIGNLSPSGSKIQELITERKNIENEYKTSSFTIKSNMSGCVSYKIDNLENVADISKILDYKIEDFDKIKESYNNAGLSNFGIKVVDNFLAYIFVKIPNSENNQYIKENNTYDIRLVSKFEDNLKGTLVKTINDNENNIYCIFKINNNIEKLIDVREVDVEIIWKSVSGMSVLNSAINKTENNINYVRVISGGEYIDVPVKVIITSDTVSIVENYTKDELNNLDFNVNALKNNISLYDILMVNY